MSRPMQATLLLACTLFGCADPVSPPGPWLVTVTNAPPASAKPGAVLPEVTLRFSDASGTPAANRPVRASGDGTIELSSDMTDGSGRVRVKWSLPRWPGLDPSGPIPGLPGEFSASVELGNGDAVAEFTTSARLFRAEQVDAADGFACGVRTGELWCWGSFELRLGQIVRYLSATRMSLPSGLQAIEVRVNDGTICIRDATTNRPWCLSLREGPTEFRLIADAPALLEVVDRGRGFCGRALADAEVWCWSAQRGALGAASHLETLRFSHLTGQSSGFYESSQGHICGLDEVGTAWCWGDNAGGQIGDGTTTARDTPVPVSLPEPLVSLRASRGGACGVAVSGQIFCWGSPLVGGGLLTPQLVDLPGTGPVVPNDVMVYRIGPTGLDRYLRGQPMPRFAGLDEAMRVVDFTGERHACALGAGGEVWCSWTITDGISAAIGDTGFLWPVHEP